MTKESQNKCDPLPYTSLAEEWENYETLLLFIQPSNLDMNRGNIRCKKSKGAKRNLSSSKGQDRPRMTKESQDKCDSVLYTSLAEERENFETLLLFIQPSSAPQRDLLPKKEQPCNPDLSDLPSARYTLPPEYVDDLLNDLTINRSQGDSLLQEHQCNFNLDLSDLPPTQYSLPSNFVDEFLSDLEKMDVAHQ